MRFSLVGLLGLLAFIAISHRCDAALSAMSIDLGSQFIKIGIVKRGVPMDIVLNKESRRKTPNVISFKNDERFFADAAAAMASLNPQSSYSFLLSLLSKTENDDEVKTFKNVFPFTSLEFDEHRKTIIFPYKDEKYNVETLLAMILWNAKKVTEEYAGQSVKDAVITVPSYFNQAERRAVVAAAKISGLNLLQLLNDGSAAALNYGVFRRKEITEEPKHMLIYDMGATKTTATIVKYSLEGDKKNKNHKQPAVRTLGVGYDKTLGGLEITRRMRGHLEKVFRDSVKTRKDITTNARAMGKLHKEAERVKQVLSANKDTFAQVESLFEDQNFRAKVTRKELEDLIADLEPRMETPIADALKMANMTIENVDLIVLMGAGTRVPKVKEVLKNYIGDKEINNFLNTDEAIAMGAVYKAAELSKSFQVKTFDVYEKILHPVYVQFLSKSDDGELKQTKRQLFVDYYPTSNRVISLTSYDNDFSLNLQYDDNVALGNVDISGLKDSIEKEVTGDNVNVKGVKASFAIDGSGIVTVSKANLVLEKTPLEEEVKKYEEFKKEYEEWEKEQEELKKKEKEEKDKAKKDDTDEKKEDDGEKPKEETPKKEKKVKPVEPKVEKTNIPLTVAESRVDYNDLSNEEIEKSKQILLDFETREKEKHDREEAMNKLETMLYDLSANLEDGEEYANYVTEEEKTNILDMVTKLKLWFEDDVTFETKKEEFDEKRMQLEELTMKPNNRKKERLHIDKAIENLETVFNKSMDFHAALLNFTEHEQGNKTFTETELSVLTKIITETTEWWTEKKELFDKQKLNEDLVVTSKEILQKSADIDREVRYLLTKLKIAEAKQKEQKAQEKKNEQKTEKEEEAKKEEEPKKKEDDKEKENKEEEEPKEHDNTEL